MLKVKQVKRRGKGILYKGNTAGSKALWQEEDGTLGK
jgi:hypothetical protein